MNKFAVVRNDGSISISAVAEKLIKKNGVDLEKDLLWTKTAAMNEMVIDSHGLTNAIASLTTGLEWHINEKWENNPEFDLTQQHRKYQFASNVLDVAMGALDIDYKTENKVDYLAQLDYAISELTKLRAVYGK